MQESHLLPEGTLSPFTLGLFPVSASSRRVSPLRPRTASAPNLGHVGRVAADHAAASFAPLAPFFLRKCMCMAEAVRPLASTPAKLLSSLGVQGGESPFAFVRHTASLW